MIQPTLQSILHEHLSAYSNRHSMSPRQWQVCYHILGCRTARMGSLQLNCRQCEYTATHHFSCRDRHCPQCQQRASKERSEKQTRSILPVTYHHLVFTLPHELNQWISLHPRLIYGLLFRSVWLTIKRFGENPRYLGGEVAMTAVLHTWGENLSRHVHLHCLVPGGALAEDDSWLCARGEYLFPVRALSRRFRGAMVSALRQAAESNQLCRITRAGEVNEKLNSLMAKEWVVYSKPCDSKAERVVEYLARYTHKIAISNSRIESVGHQTVRFSVKDYRQAGERKTIALSTDEFIRRYLLHILPKGTMRIRHYGWLSNRTRREKISHIRALINVAAQSACHEEKQEIANTSISGKPAMRCNRCQSGELVIRIIHPKGPPPTIH